MHGTSPAPPAHEDRSVERLAPVTVATDARLGVQLEAGRGARRGRRSAQRSAAGGPRRAPALAPSPPAARGGLRDLIERVERRPGHRFDAPIARPSVLANASLLRELADRIDSERPAAPRGLAAAKLLLTDGASPLWMRAMLGSCATSSSRADRPGQPEMDLVSIAIAIAFFALMWALIEALDRV